VTESSLGTSGRKKTSSCRSELILKKSHKKGKGRGAQSDPLVKEHLNKRRVLFFASPLTLSHGVEAGKRERDRIAGCLHEGRRAHSVFFTTEGESPSRLISVAINKHMKGKERVRGGAHWGVHGILSSKRLWGTH